MTGHPLCSVNPSSICPEFTSLYEKNVAIPGFGLINTSAFVNVVAPPLSGVLQYKTAVATLPAGWCNDPSQVPSQCGLFDA